MRAYVLIVVMMDLLLILGFRCSPGPPPEPSGGSRFGIVSLPNHPWTKVRSDVGRRVPINDGLYYIFRKTNTGELIFAVKQGTQPESKEVYEFPDGNEYQRPADERYALSLDGGYVVRPATIDEWKTAEKIRHSYYFVDSWENPAVQPDGVRYGNRVFAKSGESWGNAAALVSPSKTWIAVFSYTGAEKPVKPVLPVMGGGNEPGRGEVFLDIYDIASGEKMVAAHAPYGDGFAPSMLFSGSVWLEDQYLVMPLHFWLNSAVVAILPAKDH